MRYPITEIASAIGAPATRLADDNAVVSQLLIDSRSLSSPAETLFFALRTANNDGHRYVDDLYSRGVRNFVVETLAGIECRRGDANFLVVTDTLDALQSLATFHRRRFRHLPVIGITGSRGKTTVKEWLYQLLGDDYRIVRSPRSYNSQIGVPLSLWDIDDDTSLAIIEAGISTTGEMANLQAMIRPTMGVITNIGAEHNDGFTSMQEKAIEKAKILFNCDCIVYCADDRYVQQTIKPMLEVDVARECAWSMGGANAAIRVTSAMVEGGKSTITYEYEGATNTIEIPFATDRDIENALTCLAVMHLLDVKPDVIAERMARLTPVGTRINVIEGVNNCTIVADGYTSDYNSLTPALDFMSRRAGSRPSTVILSDIAPDVYSGDDLYHHVSEWLCSKHVSRLLGVGPEMMRYASHFDGMNARFFADTAQLLAQMSQGDFEDETILVKGAPEFDFGQILDMLEVKQHQTVEEVDLNALAHNFKFFKSKLKPTTKTVAMVKASGYGAGSYEIAKTLQDRGADYLAVAVQDEGVELRKAGITMPIIVLNPSIVNYKAMFLHDLEPEVYSLEECRELIKEGAKCGVKNHAVHIKIDTGMHRLGFTFEQLPELVELLSGQDILKPSSVFSHLCVADEPSQDDYTRSQFEYFDRCCKVLQDSCEHHLMRHILNTTGIVRFPEHQLDMVRIGIGLYGIKTIFDGAEDTLQPVSSLRSVIISVKEWPAGTTIGYGRHGVLTRDSRIATVTIGYGDGFDRHFGNGAISMWAGGKRCPTVGNVCMDAVMIDITDTDCRIGDRVEIFGPHIPVEELSEARGTIPYEILTSVSPRVKRVYYRE
ncbi:MAG: bifunctional UDP-N-acetylmuramoyl-tripeptide:D-alanyl-D-alanine ligase/alanine racemase [Bacteroidales bacterium]|nr:bifunctional UDP-N-acetylmuramoyl-tripeptide:D-alanyl-D-alanine ligase/alanine racemase [Candidatus Sodaliphilus aphodohippi]